MNGNNARSNTNNNIGFRSALRLAYLRYEWLSTETEKCQAQRDSPPFRKEKE